jgi:hypothetical protein
LITIEKLAIYPWSSLSDYLNLRKDHFVNPEPILNYFGTKEKYKKFIFDRANYQKDLENVKHLILE